MTQERRTFVACGSTKTITYICGGSGFATASYLTLWLLDDRIGAVRDLLRKAGLVHGSVSVFSRFSSALVVVVILVVWKTVGLTMLLLMSGMQAISKDYYEAAWWNFGLWLDDPHGIDGWRVERRPLTGVPFAAAGAAVIVHAKGAPLPQWRLDGASAGPLPPSPVTALLPMHDVRLIPYGCARLRVAELPVAVAGPGTEHFIVALGRHPG